LNARAREPQREDATDALVDGDVAYTRGTARAALAHRAFRVVWGGTFASNVGTWMQNVVLAAFGYELTRSTTFVGMLFFAQLGPLLFLATVGGALADILDRRRLLVAMQLVQLVLSLLLAGLAAADNPSRAAIVACVLAIGVANALSAPTLSAVLPTLVPRPDLAGAVSLQSVQMNASRVIGPAIGGVLYPAFGAAPVFAVNALTYLFAVAAVWVTRFPGRVAGPSEDPGSRRLLAGFRTARRDPLVRRILTTMAAMSLFSLAFVGLMPALAAENLRMRPRSLGYGLLYAGFGAGAALGAVSIGTLLAGYSKPRIVRLGFVAFALLLACFALVRTPALAYPIAILLGVAYFAVVTSLSTVLQEHLADHLRGRVMALWIMAFGGTVPLGVLAAGAVATHTSITAVVLFGAAVAVVLAWYADLHKAGAPHPA
jgi:predicted MFS family arabinose efflux permease